MIRPAFATLALPGTPARQAVLLAAGIRAFGGSLAACPIRVLVPEGADRVAEEVGGRLAGLQADLVPVDLGPRPLDLPFARKVAAAAAAEDAAAGEADLLAWLDPDTLVLREPTAFLLPPRVALGYRPVHHRLIGLEWDEPGDAFWTRIWQLFGVPPDRQSPMTSSVGERIRPYLNAGVLVVRPERGLLGRWRRGLIVTPEDPALRAHVERSPLHALFLHQAVLTAVALAALEPEEMTDLGPGYNYPLHLHQEVPEPLRPRLIDDVTTMRYEEMLFHTEKREGLPMSPSLHRWLEHHLGPAGS